MFVVVIGLFAPDLRQEVRLVGVLGRKGGHWPLGPGLLELPQGLPAPLRAHGEQGLRLGDDLPLVPEGLLREVLFEPT